MSSSKKPQPLNPAPVRNRCPVCGEVSYSRAGIHPQCSMRQEDEKRKDRLKREKLQAEMKPAAVSASGLSPWQKMCPNCKTVRHIRQSVCGCGYSFSDKARPPTAKGEHA